LMCEMKNDVIDWIVDRLMFFLWVCFRLVRKVCIMLW